jgi:zinc/manganese transport system substrate-binding protein
MQYKFRRLVHAYTKALPLLLTLFVFLLALSISGCTKNDETKAKPAKRTIVVTYSLLASVVKELAGSNFTVISLIPNGLDIHEWEPSAKDIESVTHATLIVQNGLGLEVGIERALRIAREAGVKFFTAADYIEVRRVGPGEGIPSGDPDQAAGAPDPHLWTDPVQFKSIMLALANYIKDTFGIDLADNAASLAGKFDALDASIRKEVESIPPQNRKLVTGHESLGYFAKEYGFKLIGAIVPSLSTEAAETAFDMAALKRLVRENGVKVIFTEVGTPPQVAEALARDAGVRCVSLITHSLPQDGSYFSFMRNLAHTITKSLE